MFSKDQTIILKECLAVYLDLKVEKKERPQNMDAYDTKLYNLINNSEKYKQKLGKKYELQLRHLKVHDYLDFTANVLAIQQSKGNTQKAIQILVT